MTSAARLFIIGAGGLGREVAAWAAAVPAQRASWRLLAGFLDRDRGALRTASSGLEVVGCEDDFDFGDDDCAVVAIGDPTLRRRVVEALEHRVRFATLIHPSAIVGPGCSIGEGTIICPNVVLTADAAIGRHAIVNVAAVVAHDARVGDFATLCPAAQVTGCATVGNGTFLGTAAVLLPGARVGDGAKVAAGSVVLRRVADGVTVHGNPARPL